LRCPAWPAVEFAAELGDLPGKLRNLLYEIDFRKLD
jgi:hypothetical protein